MAKLGIAAGLLALGCGGGLPVEGDGVAGVASAATGLAGASTGGVDEQPVELTGGSAAASTGGAAGQSDGGGTSTGGTPECSGSPGLTRYCWAQNLDEATWCDGLQQCRNGQWTVCECSAVVPGSGGATATGGVASLTGGKSGGSTASGGIATGGAGTGGRTTGGTQATGGLSTGGTGTGGVHSTGGSYTGGTAGTAGTSGTSGTSGAGGSMGTGCFDPTAGPLIKEGTTCPSVAGQQYVRVSVDFPDVSVRALSTATITIGLGPVINVAVTSTGTVFFDCPVGTSAEVVYDPAVGACADKGGNESGGYAWFACGESLDSTPLWKTPDIVLWQADDGLYYVRPPSPEVAPCGQSFQVTDGGQSVKVLAEYRIRLG